jgi:hypothetical protein
MSRPNRSFKKIYQEFKNQGQTNPVVRLIYFSVKHFFVKIKIIIELLHRNMAVSLEHYYSPIPAMRDIKKGNFFEIPDKISAIDLNEAEQLRLLEEFVPYYNEMPFPEKKNDNLRYYFLNGYYSYFDGIFLYCMLRHLKSKSIVEIGSGFSSCITLDTNELFFEKRMRCIFIEPFPARLKSLIKSNEEYSTEIYETSLQSVPLALFKQLQENDILFIDSTHVTKYKSDVNYIIHEILPEIARGVYIHFHDVFYPFEYPKKWLLEGTSWNEQYILRAFLEYNTNFKIVLFNTYLQKKHEEKLKQQFPLIYKNPGGFSDNNKFITGGSIWLKRI